MLYFCFHLLYLIFLFFFFFFSSRRRHTRCLSDWSSDVCSSDLWLSDHNGFLLPSAPIVSYADENVAWMRNVLYNHPLRSEERREGKSVDLGGRRIIKKKKKKTKCK